MTYPDRLRKLKLPTLAYRRTRGDMIELYKIINGVYDKSVGNFIKLWRESTNRSSTRINNLTIYPQRAQTVLRKNSFQIRASKIWNSLPETS